MYVSASEDEVNVLTSGYSFLLKIFHERGLVLQKQGQLLITMYSNNSLYLLISYWLLQKDHEFHNFISLPHSWR